METTTTPFNIVSLTEINDKIKLRQINAKMAIERKLEQMRDYEANMAALEARMCDKLPAIEKALNDVGLGIKEFHHNSTCNTAGVFKEGDGLVLGITAVAISGKMRFLKFNGYTASGSGKNQKQLRAKAKSIEDVLTAASGFNSEVNPFSLEYKDAGDQERKSVLIRMWVK